MLVTLVPPDGNALLLELPSGLGFSDFQALVESETGIPVGSQRLVRSGIELDSHSVALTDQDVVYLSQTKPDGSMGNSKSRTVDWKERVESAIRASRINENMSAAFEHHPESFAPVTMLFIQLIINNSHRLAAFVDTGAQSTIVSRKCAERCSIDQLIDERFSGIAKGVGTGKILGRIHAVMVAVGRQHLSCSLTVIEGDVGPDIIFGLDMLKRHQCVIDLIRNAMVIHGESIPFLAEHEMLKNI